MQKYQLERYDGTKVIVVAENEQDFKTQMQALNMVPLYVEGKGYEFFAKGEVKHVAPHKEVNTTPPEQRLAMGNQKDNRSTGLEAELAKEWRKYCGHDFRLMSDKRERQKFYDKQMKKVEGAWTNYRQ
nr:MAG TPA: hypothetical protein [Caudoviricetes sp.]